MWLAAAVGFGVLLVLSRGARGPLDDPDPALQRPGVLDIGGLPAPAPPVAPGLPREGRRAVVFFERPGRAGALCAALRSKGLGPQVDVAVVVSGPVTGCPPQARVVADPATALATRFGLDAPAGGGPPVGYAVVDSRRRIRYRTLDPGVARRLDEVATILRATP